VRFPVDMPLCAEAWQCRSGTSDDGHERFVRSPTGPLSERIIDAIRGVHLLEEFQFIERGLPCREGFSVRIDQAEHWIG